jgi:hypothetical protein
MKIKDVQGLKQSVLRGFHTFLSERHYSTRG